MEIPLHAPNSRAHLSFSTLLEPMYEKRHPQVQYALFVLLDMFWRTVRSKPSEGQKRLEMCARTAIYPRNRVSVECLCKGPLAI